MADDELGTIVRRVGIFAWSMIGVLILIIVGFWILDKGRVIWGPLLLAVIVIVILNPMVAWLKVRGIPRFIGTLIGFLVFAAAVVLLGLLLVPSVAEQASGLVEEFPNIYDNSRQDAIELLESLGFQDITVWSYDQILDYVNDPDNRDTIFDIAVNQLGTVTAGIFEVALALLVGPVLAFYFLIDLPNVQRRLLEMFPQRRRAEAAHVGNQLNVALGGFLRGQLVVALIVGVLLAGGYYIIGLEFWLLIGLIGGLLNIVPFLGPWVGGALGVLVAITTADIPTAVWAIVVAVVVQQIDNNFVSPTVLRATVRLHPAVSLLVLILAGALAGVWGVVVAIPLAASIRVVLGHWWRTRVLDETWEQASEAMFQEPEPGRLRRTGEMPAIVVTEDDGEPD